MLRTADNADTTNVFDEFATRVANNRNEQLALRRDGALAYLARLVGDDDAWMVQLAKLTGDLSELEALIPTRVAAIQFLDGVIVGGAAAQLRKQ